MSGIARAGGGNMNMGTPRRVAHPSNIYDPNHPCNTGRKNTFEVIAASIRAKSNNATNDVPSTSTRSAGVSDSTLSNDRLGRRCYDAVTQMFGEGTNKYFKQLVYDDIEGEKVVHFFKQYMELLIKNFIPLGWYKDNGWNQIDPSRLGGTTILNYFGSLLALLKAEHPHHPYLAGDASKQIWWTTMRANLKKGYEEKVFLGDGEVWDANTRCLYPKVPSMVLRADDAIDFIEQIDLYSICESIMKSSTLSNENYVERSKLCHSTYSMGRSSEVQQMRFSEMVWDPYVQVIDIGWREPKTKNSYGMSHMNYHDPDFYEIDNEHAMACAFIADNGMLSREVDDDNRDYVFYLCQENERSYTGTQQTTTIRKHLPPGTPQKIVMQYTGKSPRKGTMTMCIVHHDITLVQTAARSGHKIGGNMQTYIDFGGVGLTLPAGMCLNDYPDVLGKPKHCCFDGIPPGDHQYINSVTDGLLPSNLEDFAQGGRLRPWLRGLAATVIMSYNQMVKKYGAADLVVHRMESVFRSINGLSIKKLENWSNNIRSHFIQSNECGIRLHDNASASMVVEALNRNTESTIRMQSKNNGLNAALNKANEKIAALERAVVRKDAILAGKDKEIQQLKQITKDVNINSNSRRLTLSPQSQSSVMSSPSSSTTTTTSPSSKGSDDSGILAVYQYSRSKNDNKMIQEELRDSPFAEIPGPGFKLANVLACLKKQNKIAKFVDDNGMFFDSNGYFERIGNEKSKYTASLELAFVSCTAEQLKTLRDTDDNINAAVIWGLCAAIQKQSMEKMMKLIDPDVTKEQVKKSKFKAAIYGLGARVIAYKKKKHSIASKASEFPLYYLLNPSKQKKRSNRSFFSSIPNTSKRHHTGAAASMSVQSNDTSATALATAVQNDGIGHFGI
jgi:hypothetical protein